MREILRPKPVVAMLLAVGLAGCAGASSAPVAETDTTGVPFAVAWGASGAGQGVLDWAPAANKNSLSLRLFDRDRNSSVSTAFVKRCYGNLVKSDAHQAEVDGEVGGIWRIHCGSGRIAEGHFSASPSGSGSGEGFDREGRLVRIAFGGRPPVEEEAPAQ